MKRSAIFAVLLVGPALTFGQTGQRPQQTPNGRAVPSGPNQNGQPDKHGQPDKNGQGNAAAPGTRRPYVPVVPAAGAAVYGGGGYGFYGGGQTPEGAALQGWSQVISAAGDANLANSAAANNWTQAESNEMQNRVQGVQTFWAMRDIGREERAKERGPALTPEELARRARAGAPSQLTTAQIDPVTGELHWPGALQQASFSEQRAPLDDLAAKWVKYGTLDYADQTIVRQNINAMYDALKAQISGIPPQDYVACRTFLQSLLYATTQTTF